MNFFPSCLTIQNKTETYVLMLMYEGSIPPSQKERCLRFYEGSIISGFVENTNNSLHPKIEYVLPFS